MVHRRSLLGGLAATSLAAALAGCDASGGAGNGPDAERSLRWWDHFTPLQELQEQTFAAAAQQDRITVEHTVHQTAKLGQALQLARQSGQLPDVHSNVGLELPLRQLIADGWYQPLQLPAEVEAALPAEAKVEGVTAFDGELYSFPIFNFRQYWAATWYNAELYAQAGFDPAVPPKTYDEFREASRRIKALGTPANGWINNLGAPGRIAEQVNYLAQAAGFPGAAGGTRFVDGEIAIDDDVYVSVIEFWLSLKRDGLLVEGQFDDNTARTRFAAGQAGFFFDGPWCVGSIKADGERFLDQLAVGPMLVPEAGMEPTAYRGSAGGAFFVSGASTRPELASLVVARMTTPEYVAGLAAYQDQPPSDLTALDRAEVHPAYRTAIDLMGAGTFLQPQAVVRDPEVAEVTASIPATKPDLGAIVQGVFSGQITDIRGALREYAGKLRAAREKAFVDAKSAGSELDESVFAFPNWKPRVDYTADLY